MVTLVDAVHSPSVELSPTEQIRAWLTHEYLAEPSVQLPELARRAHQRFLGDDAFVRTFFHERGYSVMYVLAQRVGHTLRAQAARGECEPQGQAEVDVVVSTWLPQSARPRADAWARFAMWKEEVGDEHRSLVTMRRADYLIASERWDGRERHAAARKSFLLAVAARLQGSEQTVPDVFTPESFQGLLRQHGLDHTRAARLPFGSPLDADGERGAEPAA